MTREEKKLATAQILQLFGVEFRGLKITKRVCSRHPESPTWLNNS